MGKEAVIKRRRKERTPKQLSNKEIEMPSLKHAIAETKEFLQLNRDPDADDQDALEDLMDECGQVQGGGCMLAGTEYCD